MKKILIPALILGLTLSACTSVMPNLLATNGATPGMAGTKEVAAHVSYDLFLGGLGGLTEEDQDHLRKTLDASCVGGRLENISMGTEVTNYWVMNHITLNEKATCVFGADKDPRS